MGTVFKKRVNLFCFTASPYHKQKRKRRQEHAEDREDPEERSVDQIVQRNIAEVEKESEHEQYGVDCNRKDRGKEAFFPASVCLPQKVDSRLHGHDRVECHNEREGIDKQKVDPSERINSREVFGGFGKRKFLIDRNTLKYAVKDRQKE